MKKTLFYEIYIYPHKSKIHLSLFYCYSCFLQFWGKLYFPLQHFGLYCQILPHQCLTKAFSVCTISCFPGLISMISSVSVKFCDLLVPKAATNQVPYTWWLNTIGMYSFPVLTAKSQGFSGAFPLYMLWRRICSLQLF